MAHKTDIDRCWARIGVWSRDGASCPTLEDVHHCRHCKVYANAGREYFKQNSIIDAREIFSRSESIAAPRAARRQAGKSVVVFRIGVEWLALETTLVNQVLNEKQVRWIPHRSGSLIKGIMNFDGNAIIVFSIRDLLGIDEAADFARQDKCQVYPRMLVVGNDESRMTFPVDDVYGRHQIFVDTLRPLPDTLSQAMVSYLTGLVEIGERQVGILDGTLLIYGVEQALA